MLVTAGPCLKGSDLARTSLVPKPRIYDTIGPLFSFMQLKHDSSACTNFEAPERLPSDEGQPEVHLKPGLSICFRVDTI